MYCLQTQQILLISSTHATYFYRTDCLQALNMWYLKFKIIMINMYFKNRLNICFKTPIKCNFILCFKYHVFIAWIRSVRPKHVACVDGNKRFVVFMFCWRCVLVFLCNENQLDALFIVSWFRQSTSTCFGHVYCPSSGGIRCIFTTNGTCYTFKLTGCWPGQDGSSI
jgi:hypothetical protein